ncbi:unnamed protein product, partial [Polarella glacialis]
PRPGKIEVPIAGEIISRRPKGANAKARAAWANKGVAEAVLQDLQKVVKLDGPGKMNWLCKAMPQVRERNMQPSVFLDIIANKRFAANIDDVMPWGTQMISMLRRELDDFQPQQVNQLQQSDLWTRFADSDDEKAVAAAISNTVPGRAAAYKAAAKASGPGRGK